MPRRRLTKPLLDAISAALDAALAGEGFDGGDFEGCNEADFRRARGAPVHFVPVPLTQEDAVTEAPVWLDDEHYYVITVGQFGCGWDLYRRGGNLIAMSVSYVKNHEVAFGQIKAELAKQST